MNNAISPAARAPLDAYRCISCGAPIPLTSTGDVTCDQCGEPYFAADGYLRTYFDPKLFAEFKKDFLLNKVLNNNGHIGYQFLQEGSLSLPDRPEVIRFRQFVEDHLHGTRVLDIGCGVMALPGYLALPNRSTLELIGLDPIDDNSFEGTRLVAVSEYIPLHDHTIDSVIFATSLDHVCNMKRTLEEVRRVLVPGGTVIVWMSDRGSPLIERVKNWLRARRDSWRKGYDVGKYYVYRNYPNWTVLGVPPGGVDPFHSYFETPEMIERIFRRAGFRLWIRSSGRRS